MPDETTLPQSRTGGIQVIRRAADILRVLAHDTSGMSLGQIALQVDLPRSTVQRIVQALVDERLIAVEQGYGGIRLGPEIQRLARTVIPDTRDLLRPVLHIIAEETGETVDLAMFDTDSMLFVDQMEGRHRLRTVSSIGERFPLTTTANGKAALSCLDPAVMRKLARAEWRLHQKPPRDFDAFCREISDIASGALASDHNEHTDGVSALGFAVKDTRDVIYAVSVPVPTSRFGHKLEALAAVLTHHRKRIDAMLTNSPLPHQEHVPHAASSADP